MPSRTKTTWRLSADGQYVRQIGWTLSRSGKRVQAKFRLGSNIKEAKRRELIIRRLWDQTEAEAGEDDVLWPAIWLAAAKSTAATGMPRADIPRIDGESAEEYAMRVGQARTSAPEIQFEATDERGNRLGRALWQSSAGTLSWLNYVQNGQFEVPEVYAPVMGDQPTASGPTLHDALRDYVTWLEGEYADSTGTVTAWGRTQMRQVQTLVRHHADLPLSRLNYSAAEVMIRYWRKRPTTRAKGVCKPIAKKSAENYIKSLKGFLKWLHRSEIYEWRRPSDLEDIKTRVETVEGDRPPQLAADDLFTLEELTLLYRYATPLERTFMLLSLNCHFGQAEISSLRMGEVFLHIPHPMKEQKALGWVGAVGDSFIRRQRRKTGVYSEWILFPETVQALMWAKTRREPHGDLGDDARLLLSDGGRPYDEPTKSGNANQQIANRFADLVRRVQADGHPEFAKRSFKMVRKTAATMIREIADGEIQGLFTSHGQPVASDELADVYAVRPFGKLFTALRKLEMRLEPVFAAATNPFSAHFKSPVALSKRIALESLANSGQSIQQLVAATGLSRSTVYRQRGGRASS